MKKQYKAPEIEVLLFDFREIAMLQQVRTGQLDDACSGDYITDNPWGSAEQIDSELDNISNIEY